MAIPNVLKFLVCYWIDMFFIPFGNVGQKKNEPVIPHLAMIEEGVFSAKTIKSHCFPFKNIFHMD